MKAMRNLILFTIILLSNWAYGQEQFVITENGLTPRSLTSRIDQLSSDELYDKTLSWIEEKSDDLDLEVVNKIENKLVHFTRIKRNAVNLNDQYFHVKYTVSVSFANEQYKLEPTEIQLKINSKYDMGWKDFDINDGSVFFKNGKPIRKYKAYINDITVPLNELIIGLEGFLKGN